MRTAPQAPAAACKCSPRRDASLLLTGAHCTPGTRDADHDGWSVDDFVASINKYVRERRERIRHDEHGRALAFDESHAYLDRNEVIAVRLCERARASKRPASAERS